MADFDMHLKGRYLGEKPAFPEVLGNSGCRIHLSLDHPGLPRQQVAYLQRRPESDILRRRNLKLLCLADLLSSRCHPIIGHRGLCEIGHHQGHFGIRMLFQHRSGMGQGEIRRPVIGGELYVDGYRQGAAEFIFKFGGIALDGINLVGLQDFGQPDSISAPLFMGSAQSGVAPAIGPGIVVRPASGQIGRNPHMVFDLLIDYR